MTYRVLVVCSANVCRSPMTVAVLQQRFVGTGLGEDVTLSSGGEHAWTNLATCDEVAGTGILTTDQAHRLSRHQPSQLTREATSGSDLILAVDRSVRSTVVRLDPRAHDRTFTLREAATLASHVMATAVIPPHPTTYDSLRWLTVEMNDARGLVRMPSTGRYRRTFLPWPRMTVHDHDIPDAHGEPPAPHRVVRELMISATGVLTDAFLRSARWEPQTDHPPRA